MVISALLATTVIGFQPTPAPKLVCPIMGSAVTRDKPAMDWNGIRYYMCCGGCDGTFTADPAKAFAKANSKGWVSGESLFDPVTGDRVMKPKATFAYGGVAWNFISQANLDTFRKNPAKFAVMPKKDLVMCPVTSEAINGYASACAFRDVDGTRYYICCQGCLPKIDADPTGVVKAVADKAGVPKVANVDKTKRHDDK